MKLDDFIAADNTASDGPIDDDIVKALGAFGFVTVSYTLTKPFLVYIGTITAHRRDGTFVQWKGIGATDTEAETEAIDALARWVMNQPTPLATP